MGTCKYCGQKAGLLSSSHKECATAFKNGQSVIIDKVVQAIREGQNFPAFETEVNTIAADAYIKPADLSKLYSRGLDKSIESFLEDGIITIQEEEKIAAFNNHFKLNSATSESYQKVVKALILRDILEGKVPDGVNLSGDLPFLLQKGESIIWVFQGVECHEQRTRITYEGSSQGVSIKIAKGVYYRTGSFKGTPVASEHSVLLGTGIVALTNKNLYFGSASKTFKTPYSKLISVTPYSDGIGLQKDGATAKPQIFKPLDGWFAYNLIANLNKQ